MLSIAHYCNPKAARKTTKEFISIYFHFICPNAAKSVAATCLWHYLTDLVAILVIVVLVGIVVAALTQTLGALR